MRKNITFWTISKNSQSLDQTIETRLSEVNTKYNNGVASYADKKYSKARKQAIETFGSAHKSLKNKWDADGKIKHVPNYFVKELLQEGVTKDSFDTMVMAISGINGVDSCSLVEVGPPKDK